MSPSTKRKMPSSAQDVMHNKKRQHVHNQKHSYLVSASRCRIPFIVCNYSRLLTLDCQAWGSRLYLIYIEYLFLKRSYFFSVCVCVSACSARCIEKCLLNMWFHTNSSLKFSHSFYHNSIRSIEILRAVLIFQFQLTNYKLFACCRCCCCFFVHFLSIPFFHVYSVCFSRFSFYVFSFVFMRDFSACGVWFWYKRIYFYSHIVSSVHNKYC